MASAYKIIRLKQPMPVNEQQLPAPRRPTRRAGAGGQALPARAAGRRPKLGPSAGADSGVPRCSDAAPALARVAAAVDPAHLNSSAFDTTAGDRRRARAEMKNFCARQLRHRSEVVHAHDQKGRDVPPVHRYADGGSDVRLNHQVLDLDNYDESNSTPVKGHDERVDGCGRSSGARARTWTTRTAIAAGPAVRAAVEWRQKQAPEQTHERERRPPRNLAGATGTGLAPNAGITIMQARPVADARHCVRRTRSARVASASTAAARLEAPGVTNERRALDATATTASTTRGRSTLIRGLGPHGPAGASTTRTRAALPAGGQDAHRLGVPARGPRPFDGRAFLIRVRARRTCPRLGEEPLRTPHHRPQLRGRFPPVVPDAPGGRVGVHEHAVRVSASRAEVGASFPNPNTRNDVRGRHEGVRDAVSAVHDLPMLAPDERAARARSTRNRFARSSWTTSSTCPAAQRGKCRYMPPNYVHERDPKAQRSRTRGAEEPASGSRCPCRGAEAMRDDPGLARLALDRPHAYVLDLQGVDLSRAVPQVCERERPRPPLSRDPRTTSCARTTSASRCIGPRRRERGCARRNRLPRRLPQHGRQWRRATASPPCRRRRTRTPDWTACARNQQLPIADLPTAKRIRPRGYGNNYNQDRQRQKPDIDPGKFSSSRTAPRTTSVSRRTRTPRT